MDIAALSMVMAQSQVMQSASISVLKKAMEAQTAELDAVVQTMEQAAAPTEHMLDIKV